MVLLQVSLSFGSIKIENDASSADVTGARGSSGAYQINYKMRYPNWVYQKSSSMISSVNDKVVKTEPGVVNDTKKVGSLKHGVSLSFSKRTDDDIFYGNTLEFLKAGSCNWKMDANGKNQLDGVEKNSSGFIFQNSTNLGILFSLNQEKTIKMGPMAGFCIYSEDNNFNDAIEQNIELQYVPLGIFGEIQLGKGWELSPSLFYNFTLSGKYTLRNESFSFKKNVKSGSIKIALSKKVSDRVTFQLEPFFNYWDFGTKEEKEPKEVTEGGRTTLKTEELIKTKLHGQDWGVVFGIKF